MKEVFKIDGMTCTSCQNTVENSVKKLPGIQTVSVSLLANSMMVEYDPNRTSSSMIIREVTAVGYKATSSSNLTQSTSVSHKTSDNQTLKLRLLVSLILLILLLYISMGEMFKIPLPKIFVLPEYSLHFALAQLFLIIPIIVLNWHFLNSGIRHLLRRTPNMDSLISIGVIAAFSSGIISLFVIATGFAENNMEMIHLGRMNLYFEAAGAILVFVSLGKHVESISKQRSTTAVKQLLDLSPETAWVKREGDFKEIPTSEIQIGDLILVKPGMVIPVDGTIESGSSDIDESLITGENIPVFKREGDPVISATINKTQAFQFRAEKVGSETTIAKIIDLVETTIARKMPIQKLADKISGVFVPIVLLISIITFITWMIVGETVGGALSMAIAVLVISCPCALGLATPVAVMVAMGKGAEASILIKNPDILEIIHKVDVILFDKTGTLTTGNPEVTDVIPYQGVKESDLLRVAGSLEQYSNHPIAKGILRFVNIKEVDLDEITQMSEIPGKGLKGTWLGKQVMVGNQVLFPKDLPLPSDLVTISESLFNQGKTVSYVLLEQQYLGLIACQDQLRHDSKEAINSLRKLGLKTIMLTGDTPLAATAIQKQINLDHVYSQVKPEEKATIIRQMLQNGEVVAMVGDGINDAVALSESSVGIAIGAGSDVAIDSADIVLMHSNLNDVEKAIILGRKTLNTIKTNLFWAFVYNLVGIPIAAGVLVSWFDFRLSPMIAALAMSLSSISVVLNALRLKTLKWKKRGVI